MDRDALKDNVRLVSVIEDTNVTDAQIVVLLNQGIEEIATVFPWPWLEETANVSLTADTRTVALPNDYLTGAVLVDDDNDTELPYVAPATFFRMIGNDTDNDSTDPDFFTIYEGNFYFSPIPSANDTNRYTIYYYETPTTMSTGGATPQFVAAFHWILVEYALWKLYNREEYYSQSERAFITYSRYLNEMMAWYARRMKHAPFIAGDGRLSSGNRDPNLPLLNDY